MTTIAGDGGIGASRDSGLIFTEFGVKQSDIDLRTVRRIAPAVILEGRLTAVGTLNGPLRNVRFNGTAQHQDEDRPPSQLEGTVHLDTRYRVLGLDTDVMLDPLSFEGIRRAFPSLRARGELRGPFQSRGTLARLAVDASLTGQIGSIEAHGFATLQPPKWGAEDLLLRFSRLDLAALTGRNLPTRLNGEVLVTGVIDTLKAPEGEVRVALSSSRLRELTLDSVFAVAGLHDSMIRVDTAYAVWKGARVGGSGTLGWGGVHTGRMAFTLAADSLIAFDSLLLATTGQTRDLGPDSRPLGGTAQASVQLAGNLDTLEASARFSGREPRVAEHAFSQDHRGVQLDWWSASPTHCVDRLGLPERRSMGLPPDRGPGPWLGRLAGVECRHRRRLEHGGERCGTLVAT